MITVVLHGAYCRNNPWRIVGRYTERAYRIRRSELYKLGA